MPKPRSLPARALRWIAGFAAALALLAWLGVGVVEGMVNGRLRAEGGVVDAESGAPVAGVRMRVREARFSLFGRDFAEVVGREAALEPDGRFDVRCRRCAGLSLRFTKPGLHGDEVDVVLDPRDEGRKHRHARDLVVRMRPFGELVELVPIGGDLAVPVEGAAQPGLVLPLELGRKGRPMPLGRLTEMAKDLGRPGATGHVRLVVARDPQGRAELAGLPRGQRDRPVRLALDFSNADGGAVPFTPTDRHHRRLALEMREAPEAGYGPVLPLDPLATETRHFYFVAGGRYGRGSVHPVVVARTSQGTRIEVHVNLLLNPDGSRNLETR